jgi:hypothetical protein
MQLTFDHSSMLLISSESEFGEKRHRMSKQKDAKYATPAGTHIVGKFVGMKADARTRSLKNTLKGGEISINKGITCPSAR